MSEGAALLLKGRAAGFAGHDSRGRGSGRFRCAVVGKHGSSAISRWHSSYFTINSISEIATASPAVGKDRAEEGTSMQMKMTSGNLLLVFLMSLFLLLFGCGIGMYWHCSPATALLIVLLGAVLWVLHEVITVLLWFGVTAAWTEAVARNAKQRSHEGRDSSR